MNNSSEFVTLTENENYEINCEGDIRNKKTKRRIQSKRLQRDGYYHVVLGQYKHQKSYMTHRLVAEHFVPNPQGCKYSTFRDGCKTHISADNLVWTNSVQKTAVSRKQIPVICKTDGRVFKTISSACREYGVCDMTIKYSIRTGNAVSGRLVFAYYDAEQED